MTTARPGLAMFLAGACTILSACTLSLQGPPSRPGTARVTRSLSPAQCGSLDRSGAAWTITGIVSATIGGSAALLSLFTTSPGKYIAAGGATALSALGGISGFEANRYAQRYTAGCIEPATPAAP